MHFHFLPLSFKPFGAAELASVCYLSDGFTLIFNLMMPPSLVLTSLWTCYRKKTGKYNQLSGINSRYLLKLSWNNEGNSMSVNCIFELLKMGDYA